MLVRNDILAELLDLLDLGGQVVGEGVLEGLSEGLVLLLILAMRDATTYLGLGGGVAARAVQGGSLHRLSHGGPQSGGTNSDGGHCEMSISTRQRSVGKREVGWKERKGKKRNHPGAPFFRIGFFP